MIYDDGHPCRPTRAQILTLPRPCFGLTLGVGRAFGVVDTLALQGEQAAPRVVRKIFVAVMWHGGQSTRVEREALLCLQ